MSTELTRSSQDLRYELEREQETRKRAAAEAD
jgi:hypothetical protein